MSKCKKSILIFILPSLLLSACNKEDSLYSNYLKENQKTIQTVDLYPTEIENYEQIDWQFIGLETDRVLFDFARSPNYQPVNEKTGYPIGYWDDSHTNFPDRSFGLPSYFGHYIEESGDGTIFPGRSEAITVLGSLLSASYMGINKSNQEFVDNDGTKYNYDFIKMSNAFYNTERGFVLNRQNTTTGSTFWYELLPLLYFCRLYNLYPNEVWMRPIIIQMADKWLSAIPYLVDDNGDFCLDFQSFNFDTMEPTEGNRVESPAGGAAYLFYTAYMLTNEKKYLDATIKFMDYVAERSTNPLYEIIEGYLPVVASVLNARHGKNYDIQRFINFSFGGDGDHRPNTQAGASQWGDYPIYGLLTLEYDKASGAGFTFAMNTFNLASNLAQTLRYDSRFANDLGKYFYNVANNAKIYYGRYLPDANHSCSKTIDPEWYENWTKADPNHVLSYEGVYINNRKSDLYSDEVVSPFAFGDATRMKWGKTDIGIYGAASVGFLAGILRATNVKQIWEVDLCKTDQLGLKGDYQKYLYYNPYKKAKKVNVPLNGTYQLYDCVSMKLLSESASGNYTLTIPAQKSVILTLIPTNVEITTNQKDVVYAGDFYLCKKTPIIQITSPKEVLEKVRKNTQVDFEYFIPEGDELDEISLYLGNTLVTSTNETVNSLTFDTKKYDNNKYSLAVQIKTKKGIIDRSSIRVRLINL